MLWRELHPGDGMCKRLLTGAFPCGCWGQRLGHLVVWSMRGLRFFQSCADDGEDVVEGGQGGGVWCPIAPGEVVTRRAAWSLLYGDDGGGVVISFRCCGLWSRGWRVTVR